MTKSKGSVVVGGERPEDGLAAVAVVPDGGGEGQESLTYSDHDALGAVAAAAFQAEFGLEGGVDRLDDLAQRLEQAGAGAWRFVAASWGG